MKRKMMLCVTGFLLIILGLIGALNFWRAMWNSAKSAYNYGALSSIHAAISMELDETDSAIRLFLEGNATDDWETLSGEQYIWFLQELKSHHRLDMAPDQWLDAWGGEYQFSFRREAQTLHIRLTSSRPAKDIGKVREDSFDLGTLRFLK